MTEATFGRPWAPALLCALLLAPAALHADVKGRVRLSTAMDADPWLGQPVQVNLDLETNGFSFSDIQFKLPEVDGGIFMQTDSTTIKLSETRMGESWQILRYPLVLYPRKTGAVTVPPLTVRFASSAGFGTETRRFDLRTESVTLAVQRPPGLAAGASLVTARDFSLTWSRTPEDTELKIGDALQLRITRRAPGISGIFFEPIRWPEFEGVSSYPEAPAVEDRSERGALTGERVDRMTWIFEHPGDYAFPELAFQWWDPTAQQLKQSAVPAVDIVVAAVAGVPTVEDGADAATHLVRPAAIAAVIGLLGLAGWTILRRVRSHRANRPPSPFSALLKACDENNAAAAYRHLGAWVAGIAHRSPAPTPSQFARDTGDTALLDATLHLQQRLMDGAGDWRGARLATAIRAARKTERGGGHRPGRYDLPSLNPEPPGKTHV
jgi:hypothetical protein